MQIELHGEEIPMQQTRGNSAVIATMPKIFSRQQTVVRMWNAIKTTVVEKHALAMFRQLACWNYYIGSPLKRVGCIIIRVAASAAVLIHKCVSLFNLFV
jgi:hypothetical protein